ncbi:MAG: cytochrome c3 family protein, partial [Syntrophorhabdaceae bacterium]|nr:cytochrome c3 family protein [Syntrophorhabdaceae bacterium]
MEEKTESQKASGSGGMIFRYMAMRPTGWVMLCLAAVLWFALPGTSGANEPKCMECHTGSPIVPDEYENSAHKEVSCTECHSRGFDRHPHTGKVADAAPCMDCHGGSEAWDEAEQEMKASVHEGIVSCASCHDSHRILPPNRVLDSREGFTVFSRPCLKCHADEGAPADKNKAAFAELTAKHGSLPMAVVHLRRAACVACHTAPAETSVHNILPKQEALSNCAGCHSRESILTAKFVSFLEGKEGAERGWINAALYNSGAYVVGATRNQWLDWGVVL